MRKFSPRRKKTRIKDLVTIPIRMMKVVRAATKKRTTTRAEAPAKSRRWRKRRRRKKLLRATASWMTPTIRNNNKILTKIFLSRKKIKTKRVRRRVKNLQMMTRKKRRSSSPMKESILSLLQQSPKSCLWRKWESFRSIKSLMEPTSFLCNINTKIVTTISSKSSFL